MHALNLRVVLLYGDLTELDHDVHQGYAYIIMSMLCADVVDTLTPRIESRFVQEDSSISVYQFNFSVLIECSNTVSIRITVGV